MLGQVSADDMRRTRIRMQEKAERDYYGRINYAFNEGMREGMEEGMEKGLQESREKGIKEVISTLIDLEFDEATILKQLQKSYDLSPEKAHAYYEKYCAKC